MEHGKLTLDQVSAIVHRLGGVKGVAQFLGGNSEVSRTKYLINCDKKPQPPRGCDVKVVHHRKNGTFEWNSSHVDLYVPPLFKGKEGIHGHVLRRYFEQQQLPVFNENLMLFLLDRPHLIPEEWHGKCIFFWGTVLDRECPYVPHLYAYEDEEWRRKAPPQRLGRNLSDKWYATDFAATDQR